MNAQKHRPGERVSISVVIPTYNYGRFISEALDSVFQQTLQPQEVIVVDDGSTDDTSEVLAPYRRRINYIRQENAGLSAARNTGILAAQGEWIALLDSDDTWHREKLEKQAAFASAHPALDLIGALETSIAADPRHGGEAAFVGTKDFLGGAVFGPSSALIRRSRLIEAGLFKRHLRAVEDRDMWLRLSTLGPAARLNARLWTYRRHSNQMHSNAERMQKAYEQVLGEFFDAHPQYRAQRRFAYAYYHFDTAEEYSVGSATGRALWHLARSFALYPAPLPRLGSAKHFNRAVLLAKCLIGEGRLRSLLHLLRPQARPALPSAALPPTTAACATRDSL